MVTETDIIPTVFLDDISDRPPIIDDGKLVMVEVGEAAVRFGKESGDPYIYLGLRVVDDPEDEGAPMRDNLMLPLAKKDGESDKAYKKRMDRRCFRLKLAATAFGVNTSRKLAKEALAEEFVGRRAWCRTKLEQDNRGQEQSRPDAYFKESEKPENGS